MANDAVIAKDVYKKQCEEHLEQKRKDIEALNQKLKTLVPGSDAHKQCQEKIAKAEKKAKEYVQSIYIMDVQMNAKTYARFMGIPMIPNIK